MQQDSKQSEAIVPDKNRLGKLCVGIAGFYAFCGVGFFLLLITLIVLFSLANYPDHDGIIRSVEEEIFEIFISKGGIWAIFLALLLFAAILTLGNRAIVKRVLAGKNSQSLSYAFTFWGIWTSIVIGYGGTIAVSLGWVALLQRVDVRVFFTFLFVSAMISALLATITARLLDLTIRGLMYAPGFGVPKE